MAGIFEKLFSGKQNEDEFSEDYVEINANPIDRNNKQKIIVRPFVIEEFTDIKPALDALREGQTVALINIKPLKDKDLVELKRAVGKLKKTCEAIEGDIAGFGEDWIVAAPSFAQIHRGGDTGPDPAPNMQQDKDF